MKIISTDNALLLPWLSAKLGKPVLDPAQAIGLLIDGSPRAVFVFNCFTGDDAELSAAIEPGTALTPAFLRRIVRYAFDELKVARISFTTENHAVVALVQRFGGVREGVKRHAFGRGRDGVLLGLYPEKAILK